MISRKLLLLDRLATLVLAIALIAAGVLGAWWWSGDSSLPARTSSASVQRVVAMDWWPWASCAAGLVLVYLGVRWLVAHLSRSKITDLRLAGSGGEGTLAVNAATVADAAATAFTDTIGVRSAKGAVTRDRGQLVATITSVIEPEADLATVAEQADLVSAQLGQVLGRDDLRCRVELRVARGAKSRNRMS